MDSRSENQSQSFFANAAETLSEKGREFKAYASGVSDKISERYSEIS